MLDTRPTPRPRRRARTLAAIGLCLAIAAVRTPASFADVACGDGAVDPGEECDDGNTASGDCCSEQCAIEPAGTACRPAAGACDVAETCDGATPSCPADELQPASAECRPASGECDVAETCTGTSAECPEDAVVPADAPCTADAEACTRDVCDGDGACSHPAGNAGVVCRTAVGVCDVSEVCDGIAPSCPANGFRPPSVQCRPAAGVCDPAESCTGSSAHCPADAKQPPTFACRPAAGACDVAELCDGTSNGCPADAVLPDGDGDALCDAIDPCTNLGGGQDVLESPQPKLVLARVGSDAVVGNDKLSLVAELALPAGASFADLSPTFDGARIALLDRSGQIVFEQIVPAGFYAGRGTRGWRGIGGTPPTKWQYLDKTAAVAGGIYKVQIVDRSRRSPRRVRVQVLGKDGTYPVAVGDEPLDAVVALGDQSDAAAGRCTEAAFAHGECGWNVPRHQLTCRK